LRLTYRIETDILHLAILGVRAKTSEREYLRSESTMGMFLNKGTIKCQLLCPKLCRSRQPSRIRGLTSLMWALRLMLTSMPATISCVHYSPTL